MKGTNRHQRTRVRAAASLLGGASLVALGIVLPGTASAQDAAGTEGQAESQSAVEQDSDVIVVTGFRSSLASSLKTKQDETSIVEAVSAEDIGKLPDTSIAESIARLPGLAAQRVNGRAQVISIRGLAPDFTTTLLNGRPQASSGDNRAVEFDQYPSELLSSVVIYKTPDASIAGMGLSGTADLRSVRPLAYGKEAFAVSVRGELDEDGGGNAEISRWGGRASISYIDQNDAGTLGWALGYAYLDSPSHVDHYKIYGYESFGFAVSPDSADDAFQVNGQEIFAVSRRNRRHGVLGTLEWEPSDSVHSVLDLYYSRFKQKEVMRGAQWFSNGWADNASFTDVDTIEVGGSTFGTSGRFNNAVPILRNDSNMREDELFSIGLNNEFQLSDRTSFIADLSYSKNKRDESYIETYAGRGQGDFGQRTLDSYDFDIPLDALPTYDFDLDYADASQISLGDRAPWGGWGHDGLLKEPHVKEDVFAVDMTLRHELDGFFSALEVGLNFAHRNKSKYVDELDLNLKNGREQVAIGSQYLVDPTSLDFAGFGNVIAWDLRAALDEYYDQDPLRNVDYYDKAWTIKEDLLTFKAKAEIDSGPLRGNIGVQVVDQFQGSSGLRINDTVSPLALSDVYITKRYTDVLPSANFIFDLGGGHRFRLAAARVMARPRMDEMRANFIPGFDGLVCSNQGGCQPGDIVKPWNASGGNPELEPWRANALDAAYEWYIGPASYISIAGFYKWLDNYIYYQTLPADFSDFPLPSAASSLPDDIIIDPIGQVTKPENGDGGNVRGIELSGALEFGRITNVLDGFGVLGSLSYTKSNLNPTENDDIVRIPGLSGTVYNITGYFEKNGFQARASYRYRSAFKGEVVQLFTNRGYTEILADKQLDAQIGYTFQPGSSLDGLSVVLQMNNLDNSPFRTRLGLDAGGTKTTDGSPLPETYEEYGRQFLLGVTYKF